jgi:hypothetical protein
MRQYNITILIASSRKNCVRVKTLENEDQAHKKTEN